MEDPAVKALSEEHTPRLYDEEGDLLMQATTRFDPGGGILRDYTPDFFSRDGWRR